MEQVRAQADEEARLTKLGKKYRKRPPSEWPPLRFEWDLDPRSQHFVYDGMSEEEFSKAHPEGLISGQVNVAEFDTVLCRHNKRSDLKELWKYNDDSKLCYAIVYLEAGRPITPPLVSEHNGELHFVGGNHRYTAAKFSGETQVTIYVMPKDKEAVQRLVAVAWNNEEQSRAIGKEAKS